MKNMSLYIVVMVFAGSVAQAKGHSGSSGNGGQIVQCSDFEARASKSYDLFEGSKLFAYKYRKFNGSGLDFALRVAGQLDLANHSKSFTERVRQVAFKIKRAVDQPHLSLTSDIEPTFLPERCSLAQVLVFHNDGSFSANLTLFHKLSQQTQAALYLHEAIYWHLRDVNADVSSRSTRRMVSYLMSGGDPEIAIRSMGFYDSTPVFCTARNQPRLDQFLLLDPAGLGVVLMQNTTGRAPYKRIRLSGGKPGLSLIEGNVFSPSTDMVLHGTFVDQNQTLGLELHVAKSGATVEAIFADKHYSSAATLSCIPFNDVLPKSR